MKDSFYLAFEDRFRGSRELIESRLSVYLPFVEPLKAIYRECKAIDLGCGRGEWLELLEAKGFEAQGVDLDEAMLDACISEGLTVTRADAVEYLQKLQDESLVVVSGIHLIEHISFESLQMLVREAFRVLKPGGLLILETPNPENLMVSTTEFYLDPTHRKPVPPKLLYFLAEYNKFSRIKVLRLHGPSSPLPDDMRVTDVFFGISPDYAVVAQKSAPEEQLKLFDQAFDKEYGSTIDELAQNYTQKDQKLMAYERDRWAWLEREWNNWKLAADNLNRELQSANARIESANAKIEELKGQTNHWKSAANNLDRELQSANAWIEELKAQTNLKTDHWKSAADNLDKELQSANARIEELKGQTNHWKSTADNLSSVLQSVYATRSWRITGPFRSAFCLSLRVPKRLSRIPQSIKQMVLQLRSSALALMIRFAVNHPRLRAKVQPLVHRVPPLEAMLYESTLSRGRESGMQIPSQESLHISNLTLHSRCIYADLKAAVERNRGCN